RAQQHLAFAGFGHRRGFQAEVAGGGQAARMGGEDDAAVERGSVHGSPRQGAGWAGVDDAPRGPKRSVSAAPSVIATSANSGPPSAPMLSTSTPPPMAPLAMATWNAATTRPLAASAWSGATRMIQTWNATGNAANAKPHRTIATEVSAAQCPATSIAAASAAIEALPRTTAMRSLRPATWPPTRLPKKPAMP